MNFKDIIRFDKLKKLKFQGFDYEKTHKSVGGGIYRMYDKKGKIVYVGKSNDIHRRMHQHFGKDTNSAYFIDEVDYVEILIEDNPVYQTFLEGVFMAYHMPKYNDEVKDSKKEPNT
jgi:excinuclease ABC subunit C